MKNFTQRGDVLSFTASADLTGGQVLVLGNTIGVVAGDVTNGGAGELNLTGVYTVPKVAGAVIAKGETLTWDASAAAFDDNAATPASGDITGPACVAWEAAGNGVTSLQVKFTGVPGARTA